MKYKAFELMVVEAVKNKVGKEFIITVQQVLKNNGVLLNGLVVLGPVGYITPTIYLEPYFEQYQDGMPLEEIIEDILCLYQNSKDNAPKLLEILNNFESVKDKIVYKLIGQKSNERLLSDVPYLAFLDMDIAFYILLDSNDAGQMTALIHNEHIMLWNVTKEEIHRLAEANTQSLLPARIAPIRDILHEIIRGGMEDENEAEGICKIIDKEDTEMKSPLYVLNNETGQNGAACILYHNVLKNFSQEMGMDIIVLPSSTHEVLLLPHMGAFTPDELYEMVCSINQTLPVEDVLTDQVYIYKREADEIQLLK